MNYIEMNICIDIDQLIYHATTQMGRFMEDIPATKNDKSNYRKELRLFKAKLDRLRIEMLNSIHDDESPFSHVKGAAILKRVALLHEDLDKTLFTILEREELYRHYGTNIFTPITHVIWQQYHSYRSFELQEKAS